MSSASECRKQQHYCSANTPSLGALLADTTVHGIQAGQNTTQQNPGLLTFSEDGFHSASPCTFYTVKQG